MNWKKASERDWGDGNENRLLFIPRESPRLMHVYIFSMSMPSEMFTVCLSVKIYRSFYVVNVTKHFHAVRQ